jgi:hypothetical protein
MDSFFTIVLSPSTKQYIELINDICRMVTIQITIQFLFFINNPAESEFFSAEFILLVIYVILAVCLYWLVIKKLIIFK